MEKLAVDPHAPEASALAAAAAVLREDGIVAFPTETYYGLAVNARSAAALERLNRLKQRPATPILLLIGSSESVGDLVDPIPQLVAPLARQFWPGPLTLVLPARSDVPHAITAGRGSVGLRVPGLAVARRVAHEAGGAISGVSANLHGSPPCVNAADVAEQLRDGIDLILDGGATAGGEPSTLLDLCGDPARVLRSGAIPATALRPICPGLEEPSRL